MAGDQIIAIDEELTKNMTLLEAVKKLRGKKGSSVTITIHRPGWKETKDFAIVRDDIPLHSVKSMELQPNLFYVRIANFQANTTRDLDRRPADQLKKGAINGLLLDLRNNPGGLLDQAVSVADIFLNNGIIVSTKGRDPRNRIWSSRPSTDDELQVPDGRSGQRRFRQRLGDCRRGAPGPRTGHHSRHQDLRQGLGADHHPPAGRGRAAPDHRQILYAQRRLDPGHRHQARHHRCLHAATDLRRQRRKTGREPLRERDLPNHFENEALKDSKKTDKEGGFAKGELTEAEERLQNDNQLRTALYIMNGLQIASQSKGKKQTPPKQAEQTR